MFPICRNSSKIGFGKNGVCIGIYCVFKGCACRGGVTICIYVYIRVYIYVYVYVHVHVHVHVYVDTYIYIHVCMCMYVYMYMYMYMYMSMYMYMYMRMYVRFHMERYLCGQAAICKAQPEAAGEAVAIRWDLSQHRNRSEKFLQRPRPRALSESTARFDGSHLASLIWSYKV